MRHAPRDKPCCNHDHVATMHLSMWRPQNEIESATGGGYPTLLFYPRAAKAAWLDSAAPLQPESVPGRDEAQLLDFVAR
jgi:hypothetical protein